MSSLQLGLVVAGVLLVVGVILLQPLAGAAHPPAHRRRVRERTRQATGERRARRADASRQRRIQGRARGGPDGPPAVEATAAVPGTEVRTRSRLAAPDGLGGGTARRARRCAGRTGGRSRRTGRRSRDAEVPRRGIGGHDRGGAGRGHRDDRDGAADASRDRRSALGGPACADRQAGALVRPPRAAGTVAAARHGQPRRISASSRRACCSPTAMARPPRRRSRPSRSSSVTLPHRCRGHSPRRRLPRKRQRAEALDRICAELDVQIGLTVRKTPPATIAGTRLRGVAEAAGFRLSPTGRFEWVQDDTGAVLFTLQNSPTRPSPRTASARTRRSGVVFLLDVPRVADPPRAFDQMKLAAKRMAQTLGGELVDDNGRLLNDAGLDAIREQVAGGDAALRRYTSSPAARGALKLFGGLKGFSRACRRPAHARRRGPAAGAPSHAARAALRRLIAEHDYRYYVLDAPTISGRRVRRAVPRARRRSSRQHPELRHARFPDAARRRRAGAGVRRGHASRADAVARQRLRRGRGRAFDRRVREGLGVERGRVRRASRSSTAWPSACLRGRPFRAWARRAATARRARTSRRTCAPCARSRCACRRADVAAPDRGARRGPDAAARFRDAERGAGGDGARRSSPTRATPRPAACASSTRAITAQPAAHVLRLRHRRRRGSGAPPGDAFASCSIACDAAISR